MGYASPDGSFCRIPNPKLLSWGTVTMETAFVRTVHTNKSQLNNMSLHFITIRVNNM